jgi:glycosyltransferase involved in cell wall biosynthesis
MRVALVSREVYPFGGGGVGEYITSCARLLSERAEVAIFTTSSHKDRSERMLVDSDPRILPSDVDLVFVDEPTTAEIGSFFGHLHLYSARVLRALEDYYPSHGPDLVEFSDYLGEGAVTAQARRGGHRMLRNSVVGIRLHTTAEVASILDGHLAADFDTRMICELERRALRDADVLLWPGGDALGTYERFYGRSDLPPARRVRNPLIRSSAADDREPRSDDQLRLLYLGRFERRKGVENLIRAIAGVDDDRLTLTLLGSDTNTAPLGLSMLAQLMEMAAGDERIRFHDPVPRYKLAELVRDHDAVVLPSLWESWPYVALEALDLNRPLIANPVGAFTEMVQAGRSGWLTRTATAEDLSRTLQRILLDLGEVERLRIERGPRTVADELTDAGEVLAAYQDLVVGGHRWHHPSRPAAKPPAGITHDARGSRRATGATPLVSIVIPYYRLWDHLQEAVSSAFAQTYPRLEVLVINDGSFDARDELLIAVAENFPVKIMTQVNGGLGTARNFGIGQSRGRFFVPLDADNALTETFVERGVDVLLSQPDVAFVTSWTRYIDEDGVPFDPPEEGYQPIGSRSPLIASGNIAGDAMAVIRRSVFDLGFRYSEDLTSLEDWGLYRQLYRAGRFGIVIPERLLKYRVRRDSMLREIGMNKLSRLEGELHAHERELEVTWTPPAR